MIGVITDRDIACRAVAEGKNPLDLTAKDMMTSKVHTVTPKTSVEDCCNLMEEKQIRRVAVIDENGGCCGMVAQADIAINAGNQKTAEVVQKVSKHRQVHIRLRGKYLQRRKGKSNVSFPLFLYLLAFSTDKICVFDVISQIYDHTLLLKNISARENLQNIIVAERNIFKPIMPEIIRRCIKRFR